MGSVSKIKLSFIIPVYNVEMYFDECLSSILSQCTEVCEVILVDDGSTDRSGRLCDAWRARSSKVKVIHKENGGLSSARNAGLDFSCGKYVSFVDSDDRISMGSILGILKWIDSSDADLCFMEAIKFYPDGRKEPLGDGITRYRIRNMPKEQVLEYLSTRPKYPGSACTKIYKRSYLEKNQLRFPQDRRHSEDLGFCLDCIIHASTFDALEMPFYEYRQNRVGSITNVVNTRSFWDLSLFIDESVGKLSREKEPIDLVSRYAMSFVAYEFSILIWQYNHMSTDDKMRARAFLKEHQWVLQYAGAKKIRGIAFLVRIFGTKAASLMLKQIMRHRLQGSKK